ncbi:MAG: short chain dehydrogenase family protein [Phenylobacterium sp.]|nr:short chain dehydrogenase family protein [Phenylobacterium sp.]
MGEFDGRVVLVTGAARGLGRAVADAFAERGAALFLVDVLEDRLAATVADLRATGARVESQAADIAERANCYAVVDAAVAAFGRLDTLCNAAGIVRFNHVPDVPQDEWERLLAVNLSAPFYLSQRAIPHLLESHGSIVNVASQAAQMGTAYIVAYSATKAALVQMTRSMAMEYVHQPIRINAVAPGTMNTEIGTGVRQPKDLDMTLVQRYSGLRPPSEPQDVAELIVFVASDRARAIHGACLTADGGVTAG